jgi:acid phosphatase family membrane protein YuiD
MLIDFSYLSTPFLAWFIAGALKFMINYARHGGGAVGLIGYGGMPSNHTAIVASMTVLIALKHGIQEPAFGVALALSFIVVLDASSLRRHVGMHASALNSLRKEDTDYAPLRERIGHSLAEIAGGLATGAVVACMVWKFLPTLGDR